MKRVRYEDFKRHRDNNGKWFLVKPKVGYPVPAVYWREILSTGGFYSVKPKGGSMVLRLIKPPLEYIEDIVEWNPKEYFESLDFSDPDNVVVKSSKEQTNQLENIPSEEIPLECIIKDSMENMSSKEFSDFLLNLQNIMENSKEEFIQKNKKFSIGDKVRLKDTSKEGVVRGIVFDRDIRYICNLIKKDGTESSSYLSGKTGNIFDELESINETI